MKNIIITLFLGVLLSACSKESLETIPKDQYTEDIYWTSQKSADAALNGCYTTLREDGVFGGQATPLWEETATPNAYNYDNSMGFNVIALGTQTAVNSSIINNRWSDSYRGIGRCNTFLARVGSIPMDETLKKRMIAEAKFLRALFYNLLATYYGGVPLILEEPNLEKHGSLPRNTREEVVSQILKDLDEAAPDLPVNYTSEKGRATRGAALGLKARVLLFEASPLINTNNDLTKYTAAANAAKAVMDLAPQAGYDLFPNYRGILLPANENNVEVVFDVQFKAPEQTGNSFDLIGRQYNTNAPLQDLINAYDMKDGLPPNLSPLYNPSNPYENRDPRFYHTVVFPGDVFRGNLVTHTVPFTRTGYTFKKYTIYDHTTTAPILNDFQSETNYVVIRYADILLMYAEAQNEAVGPTDQTIHNAVNKVRQRGGMPSIPSVLTKEQMRDIIRKERRIEFAAEGLYYTDIRRWKIAEQVMKATIRNSLNAALQTRTFNPSRDYWWPVPQTERDLNPSLSQNPFY